MPADARTTAAVAVLARDGVVPGGGVAPAERPRFRRGVPRPPDRAAAREPTATPIRLRADRWVDIDAGEVRSPAVIVVEGERIAAVNPAELPSNATGDRPRRRHAAARPHGHGAQHAVGRAERREPAQRRAGRSRVPHVAGHARLSHDAARGIHDRAQPRPVREDRRLPARRRARRRDRQRLDRRPAARSRRSHDHADRRAPRPDDVPAARARHHAAQRGRGHRERRLRGAQGRALPDQVRRTRHQDLRVRAA